jgi:hypothetical protein
VVQTTETAGETTAGVIDVGDPNYGQDGDTADTTAQQQSNSPAASVTETQPAAAGQTDVTSNTAENVATATDNNGVEDTHTADTDSTANGGEETKSTNENSGATADLNLSAVPTETYHPPADEQHTAGDETSTTTETMTDDQAAEFGDYGENSGVNLTLNAPPDNNAEETSGGVKSAAGGQSSDATKQSLWMQSLAMISGALLLFNF